MKKSLKVLKIIGIVLIGLFVALILAFGKRDIPLSILTEKYAAANTTSTFVEVDNMQIHLRDEGRADDTLPIVLLHGTGSNLHTWDVWAAALKETHRVIRLDLPAYGLTGPSPTGIYSPQFYSEFVHHFLQKMGVKKCILVGNSLGGNIAWHTALAYPDAVSRLILIDAAGYPSASAGLPIAFKLGKIPFVNKLLTFITPRFVIQKSLETAYFDKSKVTDALVDAYFDMACREGNRQAFVDNLNLLKMDESAKIKTIQQPTLILWGAQDGMIPVENAHHFHADMPNDTLLIFNDLGHVPMEENGQKTVDAIRFFVK